MGKVEKRVAFVAGCPECNPHDLEGAGEVWSPGESHGSVVTQTKGGGWRAALANSRVMRGGLHYATFKLHRGEHVVLGVSRPDFDTSNGDLPSGAGGQGWGFYAVGGQMTHNGQWGDWEGMRPAPKNSEVGLLLDYERSTLTGKTTVLFVRFYIQMIVLPRQARDKHRESTQKRVPFSCSGS